MAATGKIYANQRPQKFLSRTAATEFDRDQRELEDHHTPEAPISLSFAEGNHRGSISTATQKEFRRSERTQREFDLEDFGKHTRPLAVAQHDTAGHFRQ